MIIGVTGGKGGTGKTVFAVNLAIAVAELGKKVTYIDGDVDCPSSHFVFGVKRKGKQEVTSYLPKIDEEKCTHCGLCVKNASIMPSFK